MVRFLSVLNLLGSVVIMLLFLMGWFEVNYCVPSWIEVIWVIVTSLSLFFSLVVLTLEDYERAPLAISLLLFFCIVFFAFLIGDETRIEMFSDSGKFGFCKTSLLLKKTIYPAQFDTVIHCKIIASVWKYENDTIINNDIEDLFILKKNNKYGVFYPVNYNMHRNRMIIPVKYDSIIINNKQIFQPPDTAVIQVLNCYVRGTVFTLDYLGNNPANTIEIRKRHSDD